MWVRRRPPWSSNPRATATTRRAESRSSWGLRQATARGALGCERAMTPDRRVRRGRRSKPTQVERRPPPGRHRHPRATRPHPTLVQGCRRGSISPRPVRHRATAIVGRPASRHVKLPAGWRVHQDVHSPQEAQPVQNEAQRSVPSASSTRKPDSGRGCPPPVCRAPVPDRDPSPPRDNHEWNAKRRVLRSDGHSGRRRGEQTRCLFAARLLVHQVREFRYCLRGVAGYKNRCAPLLQSAVAQLVQSRDGRYRPGSIGVFLECGTGPQIECVPKCGGAKSSIAGTAVSDRSFEAPRVHGGGRKVQRVARRRGHQHGRRGPRRPPGSPTRDADSRCRPAARRALVGVARPPTGPRSTDLC